jgi:hypothetical protein
VVGSSIRWLRSRLSFRFTLLYFTELQLLSVVHGVIAVEYPLSPCPAIIRLSNTHVLRNYGNELRLITYN